MAAKCTQNFDSKAFLVYKIQILVCKMPSGNPAAEPTLSAKFVIMTVWPA
jgi:hypothetical protein